MARATAHAMPGRDAPGASVSRNGCVARGSGAQRLRGCRIRAARTGHSHAVRPYSCSAGGWWQMAAPTPHLSALIRGRRSEILARWESGVRALPHAVNLDRPRLLDHIPELLDRIASLDVEPLANRHADARLEEGFDVLEVIDELGVLREVIYDVLRDAGGTFGRSADLFSNCDSSRSRSSGIASVSAPSAAALQDASSPLRYS